MRTEFFIARRYLFSKKRFNFISLISLISIIGVTIGVAAMIIVLSVFNGFNKRVIDILVSFDPHIRIESKTGKYLDNYEEIESRLRSQGIKNIAPFTLSKAMLSNRRTNKVLYIKGTDEKKIDEVSNVKKLIGLGSFDLDERGDYGGIVIGFMLADQMRSRIGDTLTVLSPVGLENSLTQFVEPITKSFIVTGIYESENKDYDSKYAFVSMKNAQSLFNFEGKASGLEMRLDDINNSESEKTKLASMLGNEYKISTWYDLHSDFYSILKIERLVSFFILSIIIAVASFNILGSLTMTVIEKKRDIGVLMAMGATGNMISKIFLLEGIWVGIIGMFSGLVLGLGVTLGQLYFKFYSLDPFIYKVDALPVSINPTDFIFIPLAAFILCFAASLYPARRASNLKPVEAIRWE
ncbi:ABC transporter permease [soil metagenome]